MAIRRSDVDPTGTIVDHSHSTAKPADPTRLSRRPTTVVQEEAIDARPYILGLFRR